ncbi:MAG: RNA polymerase sigma factor [Fimbriimonadales bacterium]
MNGLPIADGLLVTRSQQGDRRAFDKLVQKHLERAYQYAHRLTRDPEEAGDIVAETLLRMFKAISNFKGNCSFTTWMYAITRNCFLDIKKRKRKEDVASLEPTPQFEDGGFAYQPEDKNPSAFEIAAQDEEVQTLLAAARRLPGPQRSIIVMHHLEMKTYEEMSRILKVPLGTVKSRLNRARRCLCSLVIGQHPNGSKLSGAPCVAVP